MKSLQQRIAALQDLVQYIREGQDELKAKMAVTARSNRWFTQENVSERLLSIADQYLDRSNLEAWLANYDIKASATPKRIGVVAAGNIPLVGFHDCLTTFIAGHHLQLKPASKDSVLLPHLLEKLMELAPGFHCQIVEKLEAYDAVITTGNNNSARYFEYYFRHVPHIIRKNRNGVAVLNGSETVRDLDQLGLDIFSYFGLGCRSVSKLYLPAGYDLSRLLHAFDNYRDIAHHNLYRNNLDYNRTLLMLNQVAFLDVDHVNITENPSIPSPIANLHYEFYEDQEDVLKKLKEAEEAIQCVVGGDNAYADVGFGQAQHPALGDYADRLDTLEFLLGL